MTYRLMYVGPIRKSVHAFGMLSHTWLSLVSKSSAAYVTLKTVQSDYRPNYLYMDFLLVSDVSLSRSYKSMIYLNQAESALVG